MGIGLSDNEAGKIAGCSRVAIFKAKKNGLIPKLSDGSIDPNELTKWMAARRPERGVNLQSVNKKCDNLVNLQALPPDASFEGGDQIDGFSVGQVKAVLNAHGLFPDRAAALLASESFIAHMRRLQYEREAGKVLEVEHVAKIFGEKLAQVRNRLLAIPAEQAPRLHRCKTVGDLQAALLDVVTEALQSLVDEAATSMGARTNDAACLRS